MDWPLIYCNGDSYSDGNYKDSAGNPVLENRTYAHVLGKKTAGFVINKATTGSCNRRIVRTTISDLLTQRQLNPEQKIIALLGLSFELRSELWHDNPIQSRPPEESNFRTHTFSGQLEWRKNLLSGNDIQTANHGKLDQKFHDMYSRGRAFFLARTLNESIYYVTSSC